MCPHAGGVGLCEYTQHLSWIDYVRISGRQNVLEYVDHLHEHFHYPVKVEQGGYRYDQVHMKGDAPTEVGYSIEMKEESLAKFSFPDGPVWTNKIRPAAK